MDQNYSQSPDQAEELTMKEFLDKFKPQLQYIKSKWPYILIIAVFFGSLGMAYSILKKPTYTAVCTFVLEDSKSGAGGALGQYAGMAALAGINIGGEGGGIFQGDNILELYKSRLMIEKALLSTCVINGKKEILIYRFINSYKLRQRWESDDEIHNINFDNNPDNFNRKQDSIITDLTDFFNRKLLNVSKPDKKSSIIRVEIETKDELFSKYFTEKLVQNVNDFYVQTKTKKANQNVVILQRQADSIKAMLNTSINGVASAIDAAPNANPQMSTLRVASQKRQIDVQANSAIYSEIVKNLELAKISFRQEMPLIQVIDQPVLPLYKNTINKISSTLIGCVAGAFLMIVVLVIKAIFKF
jgi:hypothetical protein